MLLKINGLYATLFLCKSPPEQLPQFTQEFLANISTKNWKAESGATVILLSGDLGAGKTTFTKSFAKALGVEEEVTSPTFVVMKRYELPLSSSVTTSSSPLSSPRRRGSTHDHKTSSLDMDSRLRGNDKVSAEENKDETLKQVQGDNGGFKNLIHIDAYRLESGEEMNALDFKDYISNPENIVLIEWPEKIESAIETIPQQNIITLSFEVVDETTREMILFLIC